MIETYIVTWNSEAYIHLTLNHYLAFSKVIIYDNFSTDRTREISEQLGAEVREFGQAGVLDDAAYLAVKNNCWKGSKADWVIVVDDDEILEPMNFAIPIDTTIIHPFGFGMYSNEMPKDSWFECNSGVEDDQYSKFCVFKPNKIKAMHFCYGCHEPRPNRWPQPEGVVNIHRAGRLFHYRAVGGVERLIQRHLDYCAKKWGEKNVRFNLAHHYKATEKNPNETRKWFKDLLEKSVPLFGAG